MYARTSFRVSKHAKLKKKRVWKSYTNTCLGCVTRTCWNHMSSMCFNDPFHNCGKISKFDQGSDKISGYWGVRTFQTGHDYPLSDHLWHHYNTCQGYGNLIFKELLVYGRKNARKYVFRVYFHTWKNTCLGCFLKVVLRGWYPLWNTSGPPRDWNLLHLASLYGSMSSYAFHHALRYWAQTWHGGRDRPEFWEHNFKATPLKVKGHPEVNLL